MQLLLLPATLNRHKIPFRMKLYQAVRIALEAEVFRERATMLCYTYFLCCTYFVLATKIILNNSMLICIEEVIHYKYQPVKFVLLHCNVLPVHSLWPRGLRHRSAAARLRRLWVRIPPVSLMYVYCECCVLSGRGSCDGLITRPEESYRQWCVVLCEEALAHWGLLRQKKIFLSILYKERTQTAEV
jgi:hypothetical protein